MAETYPVHPRFPGNREIPKADALPSTLSVWTLADPEIHMSRTIEHRADQNRKDTLDESGPPDPSTGVSPMTGPELPTVVDRHASKTGTSRCTVIDVLCRLTRGACR